MKTEVLAMAMATSMAATLCPQWRSSSHSLAAVAAAPEVAPATCSVAATTRFTLLKLSVSLTFEFEREKSRKDEQDEPLKGKPSTLTICGPTHITHFYDFTLT